MNITTALDIIRDVVQEHVDDRAQLVAAWGVVESSATPRNTVNAMIYELGAIDTALAEMVADAQNAAEEAGNFSPGFFTGDNDDVPVCVPEDAAPELDSARTLIQEAIEALKEEQS